MTYQEKQELKKEYYQEKAQQAERESMTQAQNATKLLSCLSPGQPIIVGHHSEGKHRRLLKNVDSKMKQSNELQQKAEYYKQKAMGVGNGGVSVLDENAIDTLQQQLDEAIKYHADMKAGLVERDHDMSLAYANTRVKKLRERIAAVQKAQAISEQAAEEVYNGFRINYDNNRINFVFDGKPAPNIISALKSHGFRWSPMAKVWTRVITNNALYQKNQLVKTLTTTE
jgi:hypothetical protein